MVRMKKTSIIYDELEWFKDDSIIKGGTGAWTQGHRGSWAVICSVNGYVPDGISVRNYSLK